MAFKITKTEEKPLLARKEVEAELSYPEKSTPSNKEVAKMISDAMKVDIKTVIVNRISTEFGSTDAKVSAYVYNSEDDLKRIQPKNLQPKEEKKKEEDSAEESAEEVKK